MADTDDTRSDIPADTSAEKAYAAAAAVDAAVVTEKAQAPAQAEAVAPIARAPKPAAKPAPAKSAPAKPTPAKPRTASTRKPRATPKATRAAGTAPKTARAGAAAPRTSFIAQPKETFMDMTASITDAVNGAQEKAKEAFTKTSALANEYGEFAKGNVEAFVESGKILASGLQELGNKFIADGKSAFETATADVKALSGVKSPTDFFKLQTELLRRNFDTAIAYGSKNSEAVFKLTNEVIAPISGRVSLAVEKVRKAA
ncbi:MAG: phasin family protein [Novosphingobium sp.]